MPKPDLSDLSLDELTELIDEATNLRTTKYEDRRKELMAELQDLESRMGKKTHGPILVGRGKTSPAPTHRSPDGETWAGRGGIPKWGKALGAKTKEDMEKYRIK